MTNETVTELIQADKHMRAILTAIEALNLADAWLAAGTVRNFIWNQLAYGTGFDVDTDIDVVFYDLGLAYEASQAIEKKLKKELPAYRWEVRNQVYMHHHSPNTLAYQSTCDAISKYPERCTAIATRLVDGQLDLFAPYGLDDILSFECHPTPHFLADDERMVIYRQRLAKKDWRKKWPQITYFFE